MEWYRKRWQPGLGNPHGYCSLYCAVFADKSVCYYSLCCTGVSPTNCCRAIPVQQTLSLLIDLITHPHKTPKARKKFFRAFGLF
jgi:hypothetical protein